jgi:hypothetical protein
VIEQAMPTTTARVMASTPNALFSSSTETGIRHRMKEAFPEAVRCMPSVKSSWKTKKPKALTRTSFHRNVDADQPVRDWRAW